jgi:hypothetical protein
MLYRLIIILLHKNNDKFVYTEGNKKHFQELLNK